MTKTEHLSLMEMGAYDRLLDWYYQNRKPIPNEGVQMHRICKAISPEEQAAVDKVVREFFTLENNFWHNATADEEILKASGISVKRTKAQAEKEKKRLEKISLMGANAPANDGANDIAKTVANAPTTTINNKQEENIIKEIWESDFIEFFKIYPKATSHNAARESFSRKMSEGVFPETILNAVKNYARKCERTPAEEKKYIKNPARWLDDGCYLDPDLQVPFEIKDLSQMPPIYREAYTRFGEHIADNWFSNASLEGKTLIVKRQYIHDFIRDNYKFEMRDLFERIEVRA